MNRKNPKAGVWVAEAALLLALLVVVQLLTFAVPKSVPLIGQLFTGSLVNMVLIVGVGSVGFSGTAVAAVASPLLAYAFGQMPFPQMIPVVAIGNLIIVAVLWAFLRPGSSGKAPGMGRSVPGIVVGALAKTAFLWAATVWVMVPMFFNGKNAVAEKLSMMFSWPQGVTAIIGGILALLILPSIRVYRNRRAR
jgi:hypothetical protein